MGKVGEAKNLQLASELRVRLEEGAGFRNGVQVKPKENQTEFGA